MTDLTDLSDLTQPVPLGDSVSGLGPAQPGYSISPPVPGPSPASSSATGGSDVLHDVGTTAALAQAGDSLSVLLADEIDTESLDQFAGPLALSRLGAAAGLFRVLRLKHPTTANHSVRVALGCAAFGRHLGLEPSTQECLELSALLHDVGKLAMPDQVLNKPARLNSVELAVMERHLQLAVHVIEPFCSAPEILDAITFAGHWYDGTRPGNSDLRGDKLPLGARILAIQNAFDSMTSDVVYRAAFSVDEAIEELSKNAGEQFDPTLTQEFIRFYRRSQAEAQSQLVRQWVDRSSEQADSLWTLVAPVSQVTSDALSIFQQRLLESMHDGVVFFDEDGRIVVWNQAVNALTGLSKESVHHKAWHPQIIDMRDMEGNTTKFNACPVRNCLKSKVETTQRMTVTNRISAERTAVNVHMMPVSDTTGRCYGAIMILHDVTSEFSLETHVQTLHTKATRDSLTGVFNRAEFDRRHEELVAAHLEVGEPLSLVICDIDRFKSINDTYGHQAGDEALISFASLIAGHSREGDTVARYGGEEFVMICPGSDLSAVTTKAERIRKELASVRQPALKHLVMTASFGVSQLRTSSDDPSTMLKRADAALYKAKELGRNRVVQEDATTDKSEKTGWASWLGLGNKKQLSKITQNTLRSSVPSELVLEKIRGFMQDNQAQIAEVQKGHELQLTLHDWTSGQRKNDRPISLVLQVKLADDQEVGFGTIIEVEVYHQGNRERRMEDVAERGEFLLNQFRSYLMAEYA